MGHALPDGSLLTLPGIPGCQRCFSGAVVPLHAGPRFPPPKETCNGRFPGVKMEITGRQALKCAPFQNRDPQKHECDTKIPGKWPIGGQSDPGWTQPSRRDPSGGASPSPGPGWTGAGPITGLPPVTVASSFFRRISAFHRRRYRI